MLFTFVENLNESSLDDFLNGDIEIQYGGKSIGKYKPIDSVKKIAEKVEKFCKDLYNETGYKSPKDIKKEILSGYYTEITEAILNSNTSEAYQDKLLDRLEDIASHQDDFELVRYIDKRGL